MNPDNTSNTPAWRFQVWASFVLAFGMTGIGIVLLPILVWIKGFLLMGLFFSVGSAFTLAKTIRDDHEAKRFVNRITEAKAERIIRDFELGDVPGRPPQQF